MYNEVKRHLEFNIFGLDLNALTDTPPSTNFQNFVDITGPIMDYKVNLEIQEKEKASMQKKLFPKKDNKKRGPVILESKFPGSATKRKPSKASVEKEEEPNTQEGLKKKAGRQSNLPNSEGAKLKP